MFRTGVLRATHKQNRKENGFTLVELAVVLLIIAIIAAFVVPLILNYMRAYRLGIAARNVATAIQRARYLATSNNTRAGISIEEWNRVDIEQYDPEGKAPPLNKGTIHLPEGISVSTDAPIQIAFDGRGVVTPIPKGSQLIRIDGLGDYYATVTVSLTGQVTVSDARRKSER